MGTFLGVDGLIQSGHTELAHHVGGSGLGAGLLAGVGDDVDDGAALARAHLGEKRLHDVVRAVEVGVHHRVVVVEGEDFERTPGRIGARGVDHDFDVLEFSENGGGDLRHGGLFADVAGTGEELFGEGAGELDGFAERFGPASDERDAPALLGEFQGDGLSNAAPGAGDDCGFVHAWKEDQRGGSNFQHRFGLGADGRA